MIRFRRGRFGELVDRQLAIFAVDEVELLAEAVCAEDAWNRAGREDAEEAYGDWQLVCNAIGERLVDLREGYAATLDEDVGAHYRAAFDRAAAARFRRYTEILE